jgi:DHA2 family methylenomycin A resistance protein-like MFS transporter
VTVAGGSTRTRTGELPVVAAACLVTTLVPLGSTSVAVGLPAIDAALDAGVGGVVALVTAYLVVTAAAQTIAGALGDRWGRRRCALLGTVGFGVCAALAAAAPALLVVGAARCAQAAFGALALMNAAATVRTAVPAPAAAGRSAPWGRPRPPPQPPDPRSVAARCT